MNSNWCPPLSGIQGFAVITTGMQSLLLIVVFFTRGRSMDAFVSIELQTVFEFRILLSVFVIATTLVCLLYIHCQAGAGWKFYLSALCAVVSLAGWACLASSEMPSTLHTAGTGIYLLSTGIYTLVLFSLAVKYQCVFAVGYVAGAVCALLFVIFNAMGQSAVAGFLEWSATIFNSVTLTLFFIENPFNRDKRPQVELRPLLPRSDII